MELNPNTKQAYWLFHAGTLALWRAENQGMCVDVPYLENTIESITNKILKLEQKFRDSSFHKEWKRATANRNPNIYSGDQLGKFLYNIKKIVPPGHTASGKGSTDEDALTKLNIPELGILIKIKKLKKIRDTYLQGYLREQVDGVIHPFFNLNLARTYRSSSDRPNLQNVPARDKEAMTICRKAFIPRPGHQFFEVDFSGIEVRIAACYHKDPTMLKYIKDPSSDMHLDMAKQIFLLDNADKSLPEVKLLRSATKNGFVFPQFYGDYYKNCAEGLAVKWGKLPQGRWKAGQGIPMSEGFLSDHLIKKKITSLTSFTEHLRVIEDDFWKNRFPVYSRWKEKWWRGYQKRGYIDMLTGFRCSGIMGKNDCINYPVQGAAFHCLLWCFIELDRIMREENWETRLIEETHDSILFDVYPPELDHVAAVVKRVTCKDLPKAFPWINVPLEVEAKLGGVDKSWASLNLYELLLPF